jgi:enediyne core biosynthesis thioesterase
MRSYEYRYRVGLEDTNIIGNVYYSHYVRWQGRCREMFLHEHVPQLAGELGHGLTLATTRVSCSYYVELSAFDEVAIRMSAGSMTRTRLTIRFSYFRVLPDNEELLVAEGEQEVVCVQRTGARVESIPLPEPLKDAFQRYVDSSTVAV